MIKSIIWIDWQFGKFEDVVWEQYNYWTAGATLTELWIKQWNT